MDIKDAVNKIHNADCIEFMKQMPENSVGAIVTDSPYGLGFMGAEWDTMDGSQFGIAGQEGENDLKVKKNFKILPRIAEGKALQEFVEQWARECYRVLKPGGYILSFGGTRTYHRMACAIEDVGFEIRDTIMWMYGSGFPKSLNVAIAIEKQKGDMKPRGKAFVVAGAGERKDIQNTKGWSENKEVQFKVPEAQQWQGWGTALKPAVEPICMARKPLAEKSVAENVLKHGVGGINIFASRIGVDPEGRFPANVLLDEESAKLLDEQSGVLTSGYMSPDLHKRDETQGEYQSPAGIYGKFNNQFLLETYGDTGGASRFFKQVKWNNNISNVEGLCGNISEKKKIVGILNGVIQVTGQFMESVEQFLCGNSIMENFQKDTKSIIKILIKQMTELKIYNVYSEKNINIYMQDCEKTISLLTELNIEDVKSVENIRPLIIFGKELAEHMEDIVKTVLEKSWENGEKKTGTNTINICKSIIENTGKNGNRFFYQAKSPQSEKWFYCKVCEKAFCSDYKERHMHQEKGKTKSYTKNRRCLKCGHQEVSGSPCKCAEPEWELIERPMPECQMWHPTQKPEDLLLYLIRMVCPPAEIVLDPFMGTGTTILSAEKLSIKWIGIDKDPIYVKIAQARLDKYNEQGRLF
jgi:site-specific DNA-methyltransferase (adenine-specific)